MNCPLNHPQSLCNPVLGNTKTVHAKYLQVFVHLVHSTKIGYIRIHSSSCPSNGLSDILGTDAGVPGICSSCSIPCLIFSQLQWANGLFCSIQKGINSIQFLYDGIYRILSRGFISTPSVCSV